MEFSVCGFGFAMVALFIVRVSEAKDLPSVGILDEMPSNCSGLLYCHEKHEKFPQTLIDELLTNKYNLTLASPHEEAGDRYGLLDGTDFCEKEPTYGPIYEIIDENDLVRVVVQSETRFKQQLKIERCLSRTPHTLVITSSELEDNEFECHEKTIDYAFLVLTRDGKGIESAKTKKGIPVCCSCRSKKFL